MDIATLGIAVDSSQADKGAVSLTKLSAAAKRAEAATKGTAAGARSASAASAAVSGSANSAAAALNSEAAAATKAASAMRMHAAAVNDNARRMSGSFSGLAAQVQDIGVTAAMGMNPMIIALQQGTQIAGQMEYAMQNGGSAASVFRDALGSLISPVSLISILLTALLAAGLQFVDWAAVAAGALNGLASILQAIAPYAAMAAAGLALLYAPAIIGGIVQVIALLGRLTVSAVTAAAAMAAANPGAAFVLGITAAVAAANIFRDELTRILGVDLVAVAKTGANFIIGSFVAAFEDLKFVWNQFPNIIGAAAVGAANAAIRAMESMINSASGMLNELIGSVNSALAVLPGGFQIGEIGTVDFGQIANPFAGELSGALGERNAAVQSALSQDYIGNFGSAVVSAASGAAEKLREFAGSFNAVEEAAGKAGGGAESAAKRATDAWEGLRETTNDAASAFLEAGKSTGGILKGLIDGTLTWREALSQALSVALRLMQSLNPNFLGGGFLQGLLGGLLGFASGGYTGDGSANAAAGIVHGKEYVFNAKATARIGKANLDALHKAANGYKSGGYVAPVIPRVQSPANEQPLTIELVSRFDADGGFDTAVERTSRPIAQQVSAETTARLARSVPAMVDARNDERDFRRIRPMSAA